MSINDIFRLTVSTDIPKNIIIYPKDMPIKILSHMYISTLSPLGVTKQNTALIPIKVSKAPVRELRKELVECIGALIEEDTKFSVFVIGTKLQKLANSEYSKVTFTKFSEILNTKLRVTALPKVNAHMFQGNKVIKQYVTFLITGYCGSKKYTKISKLTDAHISKLAKNLQISFDIETNFKLAYDGYITAIGLYSNTCRYIIINISANREQLQKLFKAISGSSLIAHNAVFDMKHIIYNVFMDRVLDIPKMLEGLKCFKNVQDTALLAFCANNNTNITTIGLKAQVIQYVGVYAEDLSAYGYATTGEWLERNLEFPYLPSSFYTYCYKDTYATFKLFQDTKKHPRVYKEILRPSIHTITKMGLIGVPLSQTKVEKLQQLADSTHALVVNSLTKNTYVEDALLKIKHSKWKQRQNNLKTKECTLSEFDNVTFNFNSGANLRILLFETLKLPSYFKTASGAKSTDKKSIKFALSVLDTWSKDTKDIQSVRELLNNLLKLSELKSLLSTFLPSFHIKPESLIMGDKHMLRGNLRLGGTQSGRLSSANPNMQNAPSGSEYGKMVKDCFTAPDGWLLAWADFSALEHRIKTIQTGAKNLIKIYTEGFDSHSLNALSYFPKEMPDIAALPKTPENVNTIEDIYPDIRSKSKGATFALMYEGTVHTLINSCGFSEHQALEILKGFNNLYPEIREYNAKSLAYAKSTGYVELAFGLRLHTVYCSPNTSLIPHWFLEKNSEKEARSFNNAKSQSWGMLINRALNAIDQKITDSRFSEDILLVNTIHDAGYFLVKNSAEAIMFLNNNLIHEMQWNSDPEINSQEVPITAEMFIGNTLALGVKLSKTCSILEVQDAQNTILNFNN